MRVAFITGSFPAMSETFILGQITGLIDRGVDVRIFSITRPVQVVPHREIQDYGLLDRTTYLGAAPHTRWSRWLRGILLAPRFCLSNPRFLNYLWGRESVKGFLDIPSCSFAGQLRGIGGFDLVHAQFGVLGAKMARLRAAGILDTPLVTSFRGGDTTIALAQNPHVYAHLFRWGDAFLPVSRFLARRLLVHGCPPDRTILHHSALNLDEFSFRARSLPSEGPTKLLCIARLVEVKGVSYAVQAARTLFDRGFDVQLHVLGDGPLRPECERLISALGLRQRVFLQGDCSKARVRRFLEDSHILVCPSIVGSDGAQEGMPNAVKEAMASGVPVVATDTGGIPELIQDGVTGLIVPEKDPQAIADAIEHLIRCPQSWTALCLNARHLIEEEFDSQKLNDHLVRLYRDLVENGVPDHTHDTPVGPCAECRS